MFNNLAALTWSEPNCFYPDLFGRIIIKSTLYTGRDFSLSSKEKEKFIEFICNGELSYYIVECHLSGRSVRAPYETPKHSNRASKQETILGNFITPQW